MRFIVLYLIQSLYHPYLARVALALTIALCAGPAHTQDTPTDPVYFVADIELHTAQEFGQLLDRAEQLLLVEGAPGPGDDAGGVVVTLILHGPVLKNLLRENYRQNTKLVNQAASLSALEVIDVKACQSWMSHHGISAEQLQPFIEVVAYGPAEVQRLVEEQGYLYF